MPSTKSIKEMQEAIVATKTAEKIARQAKLLETPTGIKLFINGRDLNSLSTMVESIEDITETPLRVGFRFDQNAELIIGIATTLQYLKREQREAMPSEFFQVFTPAVRDTIITSYGRLPYFKEKTMIKINEDGELVELDPASVAVAEAGIPANIEELQVVCEMVQNDLNLIGDLDITQAKQAEAWSREVAKLNKTKQLMNYKALVEAEDTETE